MSADAFSMNRFTLHFAGADMEAAFADEQARKALRPVRIALAFLGALSVGYYVLTIHVFTGIMVGIGADSMLRATIGSLVVFALVYALTYRPVFMQRQQLIMFLRSGSGNLNSAISGNSGYKAGPTAVWH